MKTRWLGFILATMLSMGTVFGYIRQITPNPPFDIIRSQLSNKTLTATQVNCVCVDTDGSGQPQWLVSTAGDDAGGFGLWFHFIVYPYASAAERSVGKKWVQALNWEDMDNGHHIPCAEIWMDPAKLRAVEIEGVRYCVQDMLDAQKRRVLRFYRLSNQDSDSSFSVVLGDREGKTPAAQAWRAFYRAIMGGQSAALRLNVISFPVEALRQPGFDFAKATAGVAPPKITYRRVTLDSSNLGWQAFELARNGRPHEVIVL